MKNGIPYLIVDTNVWLASYLPNRPGHDSALAFFTEATDCGAQLLYAVATIRDVFHLAERSLKEEARSQEGGLSVANAKAIRHLAWGMVDNMREMATAVGLDDSDLWMASKWRTLDSDLENNIVRAAATRADADLLVTYDKGMLSKSIVPTVTPEDAITWLEAL